MKIIVVRSNIILYFLILFLFSCNSSNSEMKFEEFVDKALHFESQGNFDKALENIKNAIELDPSISNLYAFRGKMHSQLGRDSLALSDYEIAIKINPRNTLAHFYKALSFSYLKMEDSAIVCFGKAIQIKSSGQVYLDHNYNEFTDFENKTDVEMKVLRYNRGISYYEKKRDDEALEDFQFSRRNNYKKGECYSYIGTILLSKGSYDEGCEMLKNGASLNDSFAIKQYKKYCIEGN